MNIHEKLNKIQSNLKAPKNQWNDFGKYKYRNCEDILEAVKPLLNGLVLTLSDNVKAAGDRVYIEATASLSDGEHTISVTACAREAVTKKGMDDSQITGSTSSYARKYALNGLFAIDDTKDADTKDNRQSESAETISPDQVKNIENAANVANVPVESVCKAYGVKRLTDISSKDYQNAINRLQAKAAS